MPKLPITPDLTVLILIGGAGAIWYGYQILSRKRQRVLFKVRAAVVYLFVSAAVAVALLKQGASQLEAGFFGVLAGYGASSILVRRPKHNRRIPSGVRRAVIARDLTSKGLKWDPRRHHIDHVVAFSRGGDNSLRNLRVIEKTRNLRKAGKMPGIRDFF